MLVTTVTDRLILALKKVTAAAPRHLLASRTSNRTNTNNPSLESITDGPMSTAHRMFILRINTNLHRARLAALVKNSPILTGLHVPQMTISHMPTRRTSLYPSAIIQKVIFHICEGISITEEKTALVP
jgi:hypothetical protein